MGQGEGAVGCSHLPPSFPKRSEASEWLEAKASVAVTGELVQLWRARSPTNKTDTGLPATAKSSISWAGRGDHMAGLHGKHLGGCLGTCLHACAADTLPVHAVPFLVGQPLQGQNHLLAAATKLTPQR